MFVRKKKNKSGTVSVQIIDKRAWRYHVERTIGAARDAEDIARLERKAKKFLNPHSWGQFSLFPGLPHDDAIIEDFLDTLAGAQIRVVGPELIFGILFDQIGFSAIHEELFRHLVIARLAYPASKLKTADYLARYRGVEVSVQTIYRFLDTLQRVHKDTVERIAYEHTRKILGNAITVVFYDMTTLYFEAEDEDDLRKIGFSKDGKFQCPQIMLGLLVGSGGYPIGYDIFEGNTFEGHTLLPILEKIGAKYGFGKPTVVADAGLLSKDNITKLIGGGYTFIIGARIKNETDAMKTQILAERETLTDGDATILKKADGTRLIVSFSEKRARKDAYMREKGLKRLRIKIASGKLTKAHINDRGYNKFLTMEGEVAVAIDDEKIATDKHWDGLKGYVTNTILTATEVIAAYGNLWQIEKAFRISKSDLRVRPIFHRVRRRIEAHLCITFVAYTIWKELERLLKKHTLAMSPERAAELARTIYALTYTLPQTKEERIKLLRLSDEQEILKKAVDKSRKI